MHILLISATHAELEQTVSWINSAPNAFGNTRNIHIEHLVTGVGQLQTAYFLLKRICTHRPDIVLQAGIGGSPNDEHPGQVFGIRTEELADLGVSENGQFRSIFDLKLSDAHQFPFEDGLLKNPYYQLMEWTTLLFLDGITVNEISTDPIRINLLKQKSSNFVESMEGAAFHFVCLMEKIPFLQIRSVSNILGERDKKNWKMKEAINSLNQSLISLLKQLYSIDEAILRI